MSRKTFETLERHESRQHAEAMELFKKISEELDPTSFTLDDVVGNFGSVNI